MKRLTLLLMVAFLLGSFATTNAQDVEVTFNVNMATFADTTDFDPDNDTVYVSGEVLESDWSQPGTNMDAMMTDEDGDMVYTWSTMLPADSSYAYKFFYVPAGEGSSWSYGEWEGGDDRVAEIGMDDMTFNDMWGIYSHKVTFNVNMATFADTTDFDPANDTVYISGEVLGIDWSEPGTNMNAMMTDEDGDLVYTWSTMLPEDSSYAYKYFYVPAGEGSSWSYGEWEGGDDRVAEIGMEDMTFNDMWGIYSYKATFNVDMTTFADTSDFDPDNDSVYISGEVLAMDWSEPGTNMDAMMTDEDGDMVYTWSTMLPGDSSYAYKYFYVPAGEGSSWTLGDEYEGGDDRVVTIEEQDVVLNEMWAQFKINFHVTEDGSTPLEGADVTIGDMTKTTDAEGMAVYYSDPVDSVTYTVSHADFDDYTWGVGVEYENVDVMVDMSTASVGDDEEQVNFTMYPNPVANEGLTIEGLEDVTRIEVYNTVGQQVNAIENVNQSVKLETANLETGIYFVNFYNEKGVVNTQKFLKQ
ncbi:MAG: T9SS type A sorting domain-containing protein [Bacteroidales bacterium]|nr:T9SS type A sorting domain-containing protein [Bacteroidales bacterium]